jgi:uncharacterized protein (DUF2236 family)
MTRMHGRDSLTIRLAGDLRVGLLGGRTFVMQVAHPAVGAGVNEFSEFRSDPWKRIEQITQSGIRYLYRGEAAGYEEGRRLRRIHANIQGVDTRGRAYHSLDPDVYGWVHTVFFDSIVTAHALFAEPLTRAQQEGLFEEWREGGRVFGLKDADMPASVDAYWSFYADSIEKTLEYNPVMDWILRGERVPKPPSLAWLPEAAWSVLWRPFAHLQRKLILATLPPAFRAKIAPEQPWSARDQRRFDRFARFVRSAVPRLPERWRMDPEAWAVLVA